MSARRRALIGGGISDSGAAAARSLARGGFEVTTTDFRHPLNVGSRFAARHCVLPAATEAAYTEALLALTRSLQPDVLVPLGTRATIAVVRRHAEFAAHAAVSVPTPEAFFAAYVKSACVADCAALGIACPRALDAAEAGELLRTGRAERVVVKPDFDAGGAAGVAYVRTPPELSAAIADCTRRFGRALIQEYVPGGAEAMKTVVLLFAPDASLAAAFTTRKLRQWPPDGGVSVVSVSTAERELVAPVLPFFRKWRWQGGAEVELKQDARDGVHKVIEINPRFPGYLRFAGHCGLELPLVAAQLALGEAARPPLFAYRTGVRYVHPTLFLRSTWHDLRRGGGVAALRDAAAELDGTGPLVRTLLADPLPVLDRIAGSLLGMPRPEDLFQLAPPDGGGAAPPAATAGIWPRPGPR